MASWKVEGIRAFGDLCSLLTSQADRPQEVADQILDLLIEVSEISHSEEKSFLELIRGDREKCEAWRSSSLLAYASEETQRKWREKYAELSEDSASS